MTDVEKILQDRLEAMDITPAELHRRLERAGHDIDRATVYRWCTEGTRTLRILGPVLDVMGLALRPRRRRRKRRLP